MALRSEEDLAPLLFPDVLFNPQATEGQEEQANEPEESQDSDVPPAPDVSDASGDSSSLASNVDRSTETATHQQLLSPAEFQQDNEAMSKISWKPSLNDGFPDFEHGPRKFDRSLCCDVLSDVPATFYDHWSGLNFSREAARTLRRYGQNMGYFSYEMSEPKKFVRFFDKLEWNCVGLMIQTTEDDELVIADVVAGGPACQSGLAAGDVLVSVDRTSATSLDKVCAALSGPAGNEVELVVRRGGARLGPLAVKRVRCDRAVASRRVSSSYEDVPFYISQQDQDSAVHEARARVQMIRDRVYAAARQKMRGRRSPTTHTLTNLPAALTDEVGTCV
ncbi:hypothetical protein GUITHDRAFT_153753 [Guillardia theta CCMP2712]|uniref:PDZ domain-containing protein n=2 Tax=Guillardia theta TaxID=55529 RepID=L1J0I8_GUITC|nr:hypothetical protein GUITHDRAFT_153753 [Guillardia theta CCMP2712]EKX41802.1 hypothetical protein GUITHDRAFT_153753 [Guillardia theta CCMP2712]|mmetsp:Transcript_45251/g.142434  ORF Transcript_45251/g.142434 Transcript_45251/m.142434 type:complete len:334 (-) Transcript_45251:59-1060(-)|eukprot:XP_005828782.1 hypothetical protein GUITHDRAFT_153753 [Guillardia theta CCMP2712]